MGLKRFIVNLLNTCPKKYLIKSAGLALSVLIKKMVHVNPASGCFKRFHLVLLRTTSHPNSNPSPTINHRTFFPNLDLSTQKTMHHPPARTYIDIDNPEPRKCTGSEVMIICGAPPCLSRLIYGSASIKLREAKRGWIAE